jgi:hypothetical protein
MEGMSDPTSPVSTVWTAADRRRWVDAVSRRGKRRCGRGAERTQIGAGQSGVLPVALLVFKPLLRREVREEIHEPVSF